MVRGKVRERQQTRHPIPRRKGALFRAAICHRPVHRSYRHPEACRHRQGIPPYLGPRVGAIPLQLLHDRARKRIFYRIHRTSTVSLR